MLSDDNWLYGKANTMIRGEQANLEKTKIKALFIEGMIKFLEIYAQSEIGDIEVNIAAIALYVNSPSFENEFCYSIKNIEDVYKIIEMEILMGLPIWRFLKLSDYQMNIFEKNYEQVLEERQKYLEDNYSCKRCIYFEEFETSLGYISKCNFRKDIFDCSRDRNIDWTKINDCENCLTIFDDLQFLKVNGKMSLYNEAMSRQNSLKKRIANRKIESLDKYKITLKDLKEDCIYLDSLNKNEEILDSILDSFKDAFNNKRSKKDRLYETKKALYLEEFIKFINLYINNEIGNNYEVDIQKVVISLEDKQIDFSSNEELMNQLEEMIFNGEDFRELIKLKDF